MLSNTKPRWSFALATLTLGFLVPQCLAQGVVHHHGGVRCNSGHCGSPLAGPCVPQRMTYGYVPTSWRRWPTDQLAAGPMPEQLPTPAKEPSSRTKPDELPIPGDAAREPAPTDASPQPPGEQGPLTPPFGSESPTPPFGDEPQSPPSAADPLAVPPSDEPPAPPADAPESTPATAPTTTEAAPLESTPADKESPPPSLDGDGPPTLPTDDPFKDDPESVVEPKPGSGARSEQHHRAARDRLAAMRAPESARVVASEPRLLRADGGNLDANRLPEAPAAENPLRQVSHPVRKTSSTVESAPPTVISSGREHGVWRQNPLRSN